MSTTKPAAIPPLRAATMGGRVAADRVLCTCVICGKELVEQKCKLRCPDPRCGYFLSCADFY